MVLKNIYLSSKVGIKVYSKEAWHIVQPLWKDMAEASPYTSFFLSSDWIDTWIEVFKDSLDFELLQFEADDKIIGFCLIVSREQKRWIFPTHCLFLNTSGENEADSVCIEYNTLLSLTSWELPIASALYNYINSRRWDEFILLGCYENEPFWCLTNLFKSFSIEHQIKHSYYVDLDKILSFSNSYENYLSSVMIIPPF